MVRHPLETIYEAQYFDGRSAVARAAGVRVAPGGLLLSVEGGAETLWLYSDARLTHERPVRVERGLESIVVADAAILEHIAQVNPESFRAILGDWSASAWNWVGLAVVGIVIAALMFFFQGIPRIAAAMASVVPVSWEERLGQTVADSFIASGGECKDDAVQAALREIVDRLDHANPSPYRFRVRVSRDGDVNAFAAPGGYIVVLRGLLEKSDSPEEVAGVLAHEMEHVRGRHVTRGLMRQVTIAALVGMVLGDASGIGGIVQSMGSLRFQRDDEAAADREGLQNMAEAGIDPSGMIRFFEKLSKTEGDLPAMATYLSTHPDTRERIAQLQKMLPDVSTRTRPLSSDAGWEQTKMACAGQRP